ncbi:MAG: peptidoglycan-binding protein [Pseudomonadota bacterium]
MTPYLLILAVLLGIAPGLIAHGKGRNFLLWWIYGVLLGPVALLHAIMLRSRTERHAGDYPAPARPKRPTRWRSNWPVALWAAASIAVAIVAVTTYGLLAPPQSEGSTNSRSVAVSADRTPPRQPAATRNTNTAPAPPAARTAPPNVRVSVRRETAPRPEEKLATAPVTPVERLPANVPNERTEPRAQVTPPTPAATAKAEPKPASTAPANAAAETSSEAKTSTRVALATPPAIPSIAAPKSDTGEAETGQQKTGPADAIAPKPLQPAAKPIAPQPAVKPVPTAPPAAKPVPASVSPTQSLPASPTPTDKPATAETTDVTAVGETVQIVQLALAKRGYDPGPANGRAGKKTQAAIRKFQADTDQKPTGSIDYALLEKLGIVGPRIHAFRPPPGATPGR